MPDQPQASSIDDLIQQSSFIGLYSVTGAVEAGKMGKENAPFQLESYDFELTLSTSVSQKAPPQITVRGARPAQSIPEAFFFIKERHAEMVESNSLLLGMAYQIETSEGACQYVPELMVGYSYLIFGGTNSAASFEPVLSTRYDPFYREVVRKARRKQ